LGRPGIDPETEAKVRVLAAAETATRRIARTSGAGVSVARHILATQRSPSTTSTARANDGFRVV
jgi:hypothetical protein